MRGVDGRMLLLTWLCLAGWCGLGCQSMGGPASAGFASVKIGGQPVDQVEATTVKVFQNEGYRAASSSDGFVFEREGSRWQQIAYGSNLDDDKVIERVYAQVVDLGGEVNRLQCTAYVVRNSGSGLEDEVRLPKLRSGYYQDLLDKVVLELTPAPILRE